MAEETVSVEETAQEVVEQNIEQQEAAIQTPDEDTNITQDEDGTIKIDLRKQPKSEDQNAVQEQNVEQTNDEPTGESTSNDSKNEVLELIQEEEVVNEEKSLSDKIKDIHNKLK